MTSHESAYQFVQQLQHTGVPDNRIIALLCANTDRLTERVLELTAIAPVKFKTSDGKVVVWRCPDELVPLTDMNDLERSPTP